jgi:phosphoribosyl-AMP cyclohydrolase
MSSFLSRLKFDPAGLVPAIAQQYDSGRVLMMAWMNRESIAQTLATGQVCYWSRSRRALWRKGETSGHLQRLVEMRVDCDGDTLLLLVDQTGVACHTGNYSCFFRRVEGPELVALEPGMTVSTDPQDQ